MPEISQDDIKNAMKEAIKEWLDEKYAAFGRWTFRSLMAALLSSIVSFIVYVQWIKVH